jgi:hypothetical protein
MTDERGQHGYFAKGNKLGPGRRKGARNKPPTFKWLEDDLRLVPARRFRTLVVRMIGDLGGSENLSAGKQQLIRRCAMISVQCELMEQQAIAGAPFDAVAYGTLTGHLNRTLSTLGLKRRPRDVTPTLNEYLTAARQPDEAKQESEDTLN